MLPPRSCRRIAAKTVALLLGPVLPGITSELPQQQSVGVSGSSFELGYSQWSWRRTIPGPIPSTVQLQLQSETFLRRLFAVVANSAVVPEVVLSAAVGPKKPLGKVGPKKRCRILLPSPGLPSAIPAGNSFVSPFRQPSTGASPSCLPCYPQLCSVVFQPASTLRSAIQLVSGGGSSSAARFH